MTKSLLTNPGESRGPEPRDDYEDHYFEDSEPEDEFEEAEMNCGEMPEGGCSLAGTEYCDWDCPFSDGMMERMK